MTRLLELLPCRSARAREPLLMTINSPGGPQ